MQIKFTKEEVETIIGLLATDSDEEIAQMIGTGAVEAVKQKILDVTFVQEIRRKMPRSSISVLGRNKKKSTGPAGQHSLTPLPSTRIPAQDLRAVDQVNGRGQRLESEKPKQSHPRRMITQAPDSAILKKKRVEPVMATRHVDTSQSIAVRIDRKTTIYVTPGTDVDMIREKYSKKPL